MNLKMELLRTNSTHPDFVALVRQLDAYLADTDGSEHAFYAQYNKIDRLNNVVVVYCEGRPVGCGAFKEHRPGVAEVKRMYTAPDHRGKGVAARVLAELESWARELSYAECILETGKRQVEAARFYPRHGYTRIPNYGQYAGVENSLCFGKSL